MIQVMECPEGYTLPEDSLCLTGKGWTYGPLDLLTVGMEGSTTLVKVLEYLWKVHGNLLGTGDLLCLTVNAKPLEAKCYVIFTPSEQL